MAEAELNHGEMKVVDSHTEGEPTRIIIDGAPDLGAGSLVEQATRLTNEYAWLRTALLTEPRGHKAMVGAVLLPPRDPKCVAGVIFFNTVGALGMCGHASIGLAITLARLGQIDLGVHRFETPVGQVSVELLDRNRACVTNVESYRWTKGVLVDVGKYGTVSGDIAWGGNWFFLASKPIDELTRANVPELRRESSQIAKALSQQKITGAEGARVDHIAFFGASNLDGVDNRNFVLCPGGAYDRSPCGTGCAAKLACLAADGVLDPGKTWVQQSIIGSQYEASYTSGPSGGVIVNIFGRAFVTADSTLRFDRDDPFVHGIEAAMPE